MPTQATQTAWSWLQDLAEIARLSKKGGEFSLSSAEIDSWLQAPGEATTADESKSQIEERNGSSPTSPREAGSSRSQRDRTAATAGEASYGSINGVGGKGKEDSMAPAEEEQTEGPTLARGDAGTSACVDSHPVMEGLKLPLITNEETQQNTNQAGLEENGLKCDNQKMVSTTEELRLPPIVALLEAMEFPSDSESNSEEDGDSSTECEDHRTPPFPNVNSFNLPWPAILQYLRESESMASEYFSLASNRLGTSSELGLLPSGNTLCDFCGKVTPKHSLLVSATGGVEAEVNC